MRPESLHTILTKNGKVWRWNKAKERRLGLLEVVNCEKVTRKYLRKTNGK